MRFEIIDVNIEKDATHSLPFQLTDWGLFYGVFIPPIDDGDVGLEASIDKGVTYASILDFNTGIAAILCASGSGSGWVDFSDWIRFFARNSAVFLRFTCAAQTSNAVTLKVLIRG